MIIHINEEYYKLLLLNILFCELHSPVHEYIK